MIRLGSRHFAAVVGTGGIHLIEYRRRLGRLQVVSYVRDHRSVASPPDLAARLGDLLEANGAEGGRLAVTLDGFGSYHQIMELPAAPPEVLRPVVLRELRHVYSDLADALVGFGRTQLAQETKEKGRRPTGPREREIQLLVCVAPRDVVSLLHETLANRRIALEHLTLFPRAVQRVHESFAPADETAAVVLAASDTPMLGFFNREGLQFFAAPPGGGEGEPDVQPLLEQMQRGSLYLRQQFRGQRVERVLLSAEEPADPYRSAFERSGFARVDDLGPEGLAPGALGALGVALDARAGSTLNLLPAPLRPPAESDPWILKLALVSALVLILASAWWGWSAVRTAHRAEERAEATAVILGRRVGPLGPIRRTVAARQAHHQRVAILEPIADSRRQLQRVLWGMEVAPSAIQLDSIMFTRTENDWEGSAVGRSSAGTSAEAARAVNEWYRGLASSTPAGTVRLQDLTSAQPDSAEAAAGWAPRAVRFRLAEKVPASGGGE